MGKTVKSWQSRFNQNQAELAVDFVESISIDARLYKYDIAGSIAHAQMLQEAHLLTRDEFRQIKQALIEIADAIDAGKFRFDKHYEDIHMVVEAALIKKIGSLGKKLHTGRSRNDQVALDLRLWTRDQIDLIAEAIIALQKALLRRAQGQGKIVMPGYTHLQRAQPILVGAYLLAFVEQLQRDRRRFQYCRENLNQCPLGCGALAGTTLPLDRRRVAELLGFTDVTRNSIDTVSDRDFCLDFVFACAVAAMHLSRLAEDWIIFASQEFAFIRIDDAYCTGSSMMPQKRNPDMLELIRAKTGQLYGNLMALLAMLKAQPLTYNRDMQEDKKQLFDAADTIGACLEMTAAVVEHTTFDAQRIESNLDDDFLDATALAEYLVKKGTPFRDAHQIVATLVSHCEKNACRLSQLPLEQLKKADHNISDDVYDHLGAANVVAHYAVVGSAGLQQLQDQLEFWKRQLS